MNEVVIFGYEYLEIEEIHEALAQELDFPDYYGANLDALYDVLTEISEETTITLNFTGVLEDNIEKYMERMWRVLCDAEEENLFLTVKRVDE